MLIKAIQETGGVPPVLLKYPEIPDASSLLPALYLLNVINEKSFNE